MAYRTPKHFDEPRGESTAYSPKLVEEVFSEVRSLVLGSLVLLPTTERPARQMPFLERYSSLPSAHNPRMPSVLASKSAKYPQLSHGIFTTPASSMRSSWPSSKSPLT